MLHIIVTTTFQDVGETHQIGIDVGMRILQGVPHARLGRQVNHTLWLVLSEQGLHGGPVGHVLTNLGESWFTGQALKPRFLQSGVVVIVDVIYADYFITSVKQPMRQMGANEARRARNQNFQRVLSCSFRTSARHLQTGHRVRCPDGHRCLRNQY